VPLLNMVLLAKETVLGSATLGLAAVVVGSTLLYGVAALALAARWFGSDAVLSGSTGNWADFFRRPEGRSSSITPELAYGTVAAIFPVFFLTGSFVGRIADLSIGWRLAANAVLTAVIFGGLPLLIALWRRVALATAFQIRTPQVLAVLGAVIAGATAWPMIHEIVLSLSDVGFSAISKEQLERAHGLIADFKNVPFAVRLLCLAIVPAIFEELCFRGFLLGAIRRRTSPWAAIVITAVAFGLFHILVGGTLAIERLVPSTLLGLALGWVAIRTGSVIPGMAFHILNNGMIIAIAEYEGLLKDKGWDMSDQRHLPPQWLAVSFVCVAAGLALVWFSTRRAVPAASPVAVSSVV
jgi:sodium transport system permease protein